ncbi:YhcN/YlaJ family sporulation lipoprotein [Virgibacillus oceani]|uniref:Lipoprotein YutC n=1 Tax=Virgibacillus oceani TaxID=1479511 RepID=A0A917H3J5_9BACI|nr:YhcN/YlaJ family sporulation lipoprotein [Virgibacillus oceani]GGG66435.1 putative lipoprotein YutC [Virgibacillus oceani]
MKVFLSLAFAMVVISGCGNTENATDERDQISDELDPAQELQSPADQEQNNRLGYVRYTKDQLNNDGEKNHTAQIDRREMANMITRIILRNDGFDEVATLVTDEEVLIAYQKNDELEDKRAADIAKRSAMSATPRFYHVYVSDNVTLMNDIHSLHNSTSQNKNYDNTIEQIINEMEKEGLNQTSNNNNQ